MNTQKIQVIRQAEQSAKDLIISTEDLVNSKIREAGNEASLIGDNAKKTARENEVKTLSEYQIKGESQAKTILSELTREISNIDHSADSAEVSAIALLKEQMKVAYGN